MGNISRQHFTGTGPGRYAPDNLQSTESHWNHRDAEHTKVTPQSRHILFLLETTESAAFGPAVDAAAADLAARAATRSRQVSTQWLTPALPAAALAVAR